MSVFDELSNKANGAVAIIPLVSTMVKSVMGAISASLRINSQYEDWQEIRNACNSNDFVRCGQSVYLNIDDCGAAKRIHLAAKKGKAVISMPIILQKQTDQRLPF